MSDAARRTAERARQLGADPIADRAALFAAYLRAGGRDPRVDPREGDVVETGDWKSYHYPATRLCTGLNPSGKTVHWREVQTLDETAVLIGAIGAIGSLVGSARLETWRRWAAGGTVLRVFGGDA